MGGADSKSVVDVESVWKYEAKLSIEKRRKRYRCGDRFVAAASIPNWDQPRKSPLYPDVLSRKLEDARNVERSRRKLQKYLAKEAVEKDRSEKSESVNSDLNEKTPMNDSGTSKEHEAEDEDADGMEEAIHQKYKEKARKAKKKRFEDELREAEEVDVPLGMFAYNKEINEKVALIKNNITVLEIDAIVNAANKSLLGGGGIDNAIHTAAGKSLLHECETLGGAETGETKITRGYDLPAKFVLHTVGPIGKNEEKLRSCYNTCLNLTLKHNIKTVAFCGISTGIYGYPLAAATHVALHAVRTWLEDEKNRNSVDLIIFCTFLPKELAIYENLMHLYFPPVDKTTEQVLTDYKEAQASYDPENDEELVKEEVKEREAKAKRKQDKLDRQRELKEREQRQKETEKKQGEAPSEPKSAENTAEKEGSSTETEKSAVPTEQKQERLDGKSA